MGGMVLYDGLEIGIVFWYCVCFCFWVVDMLFCYFFLGGGGFLCVVLVYYIYLIWFKFLWVMVVDYCEWGCVNVNKLMLLYNVGLEICWIKEGFVW